MTIKYKFLPFFLVYTGFSVIFIIFMEKSSKKCIHFSGFLKISSKNTYISLDFLKTMKKKNEYISPNFKKKSKKNARVLPIFLKFEKC